MLVLGIDTTTLSCSVAVANSDKVLAEYSLQSKKTHSEKLLPLIDAVVRTAGCKPGDLEGVAVSIGPGSFTGLRIGIATARALGQTLNIPLAGISTLEVLAAQIPFFHGLISPILDARRQQVYNAIFCAGEKPTRLVDERAIGLNDLLAELAGMDERVLFIGDGVSVHRRIIQTVLGEAACFLPPEGNYIRAATVARLGLSVLNLKQGKSYLELMPSYIRHSEAEVKYLQRLGKEGDRPGYNH